MKQSKIEELYSNRSKAELFLLHLLSNKKKLLKQGLFFFFVLFLVFALGSYGLKRREKMLGQVQIREVSPSLKKLKKVAKRYPTLQTQLDAPLAQSFLNDHQLNEAKAHIQRVEKRQHKALPFLKRFNEVSFLIEANQYKKALELGQSLLSEMEDLPQWSEVYFLHLVRLVELEKLMLHPQTVTFLQEKLSQQLSKSEGNHTPFFQMGRLNLVSYSLSATESPEVSKNLK